MVLPAQFQLGLELTNLVNPISQAMSALGSLAVIDAIKKSGSDFITETKLANLIGRHRIDSIIDFHFREMVAKSDQSVISRYLDIVLESGSGPTVQEALKNPALFSMVIQLSGLAYAHDTQSLANAIVEAIERIVHESHGDMGIVPDYVSLLGTLQACQQQTAAFRWALLYEAVEEKIYKALTVPKIIGNEMDRLFSESYRSRALPLPVLQGLFMWLQSLQSFPENRLMHLRCNTGASTVIVWCHHILGLSVMIHIKEMEVRFGNAPYSLVVEISPDQKADVTLMDPLEPQEPLFNLQDIEDSTIISFEHRAEAYGYGIKLLQFHGISEMEQGVLARSVISCSVDVCESWGANPNVDLVGHYYPSRTRLLTAGRFLFALDENVTFPRPEAADFNSLTIFLVDIIITFARICEGDLAKCKEMPLALSILSSFPTRQNEICNHRLPGNFLNLLDSFSILSLLLLGRQMHNDYVKPAVLLSAWGWSFFLESMDATDPFDVSVEVLRVTRGVPSRRGHRRTRIIDGPRRACPPAINRCHLLLGASTVEKGAILVGHHSDAFQVTQQFTCRNEASAPYRYGFREMAEWSIRCLRFPPYLYVSCKGKDPTETKLETIDKIVREGLMLREYSQGPNIFSSMDCKKNFYYVSSNPAARWLQLGILCHLKDWHIVLADPNACVDCTIRRSDCFRQTRQQSLFLL